MTRTFDTRFWRKWHRWIGFPAALFLLFAAVTGFLVAFTEFFGEDEALRERTRHMVSTVTVASPQNAWSDPVSKAIATAAATAPGAPIDKITVQFKGDAPTVSIYTGKPGGGEDRRLVMNAETGALIENTDYKDKPFLTRVHSGEVFGDGGLVVAMFWALALAIMAGSGLVIYYTMRGKRQLTGVRKVFW